MYPCSDVVVRPECLRRGEDKTSSYERQILMTNYLGIRSMHALERDGQENTKLLRQAFDPLVADAETQKTTTVAKGFILTLSLFCPSYRTSLALLRTCRTHGEVKEAVQYHSHSQVVKARERCRQKCTLMLKRSCFLSLPMVCAWSFHMSLFPVLDPDSLKLRYMWPVSKRLLWDQCFPGKMVVRSRMN